MNRLHFCGGLPRSGSTLLMNLLQQNPNIFTTGTCALTDIISNYILIKSRYRESFQAMSVEQADKAMFGLIQGATKGWFEALTNKPVVISKNRSWSSLFHLYKTSKFIVTVRDIRDVVESFEKINHNTLCLHSFSDSSILSPAMHSIEKYKFYFNETNAITLALNYEIPRLMEIFEKDSSKVFFIRYEDFTKDPVYMLSQLYLFLKEEPFSHDLDNINQSELYEHDHAYFRERTDHKIDTKFKYFQQPKRTLSNIFNDKIINDYKWFYHAFYPEVLNERAST